MVARGQRAERAHDARQQVADGYRRQHRRSVGLARHLGQARERLGQRARPGPVVIGPVLPVAADAHDHERRVHARQLVVRAVPSPLDGGGQVLHQHVDERQQLTEEALPVGAVEVERDAALVAVRVGPHERPAGALHADAPERVARGRLQLDHVGAEVAEDRRHLWGREEVGDVEDAEAVERADGRTLQR